MSAMRWGRRIATGVVLVGLVAIGLGRGVGAQTGPAFSAQIQLALRALLAGDQTITGNWTCSGTCSGFGGGGGGTPAGPVNSVQFNDAGSFGGIADFTMTANGSVTLFNYADFTHDYQAQPVFTIAPNLAPTTDFGAWYPVTTYVTANMNGHSIGAMVGHNIAIDAYAPTGTLGRATGAEFDAYAEEGTIGSVNAGYFYAANYGTATGTVVAGKFEAADFGSNLVNAYGIQIVDQAGLTVTGNNHAINYADKFVVDAAGKTLIGPDLATLTAADAYITGNGLADSTTRITGLNPTTSAMASWILQTDATTTYAFSDTAEFYNFLGGTQGGDAQALYVRTFGTGDISEIDGQWVYPGHTSTGTLGTLRYVALGDPDKAGGAGAIGTVQAIWVPALSGWGSANTYSFWHDADGVFRIKEDNHFDSVYQAIPALYNPLFTKYTPGAADYERGVWEWNGNVFEMGTQNGGTGTLRNTRVLGAATLVDGLKTTGAATGKKVVCVDTATGQLYASSTGTDCSN